jgi:hypothetical protein
MSSGDRGWKANENKTKRIVVERGEKWKREG